MAGAILFAAWPTAAQPLDGSSLNLPLPRIDHPIAPPLTNKPAAPSAIASFESRFGGAGNELNSHIVASFRDLPLAAGAWFTTAEQLRRYLGGIAVAPVNGVTMNFGFQHVEESARSALSFDSAAWLKTNALSTSVEAATPISGVSVVAGYDYWRSLRSRLLDNDTMTVDFDGAEGHRYAAGLDLRLTSFLSLRATAGQEQAANHGVNGFFGTVDVKAVIDAWTFSASYWSSPNFGNGLQVAFDYRFANGLTFGPFGGFERSAPDKPYFGIKLTIPLAPPTDFKSGAQLVAGLDQHLARVVNTMPGVPISAKNSGAIKTTIKPRIVRFYLQTVYGDECATNTPTPGCTFDQNGTRITVSKDGDYDRTGHGSDDLWYVQFDAGGNGDVYDELGHYQYTADVSSFAGHISGTTIGVGTTGLYWENVANGTYWLGQNGVLYSANVGETRYEQAIN